MDVIVSCMFSTCENNGELNIILSIPLSGFHFSQT